MSFRGGQIQQLHPTTNHNIHINVTNAVGTRKNSLQFGAAYVQTVHQFHSNSSIHRQQ